VDFLTHIFLGNIKDSLTRSFRNFLVRHSLGLSVKHTESGESAVIGNRTQHQFKAETLMPSTQDPVSIQKGDIRFFVPGLPAPGGSKSAFVPTNRQTGEPYRKNGRIIVNVVEAGGKKTREWRQAVAAAAFQAMKLADAVPLTGAIEMELLFQMKRPESHYRVDGISLRPSAPLQHVTRPDCLKLARSTEDSMTGICYADDSQIVKETIEKAFSDAPGAWVIIREAA
jgi:crossover junction endodeoxyribonuclease RusA